MVWEDFSNIQDIWPIVSINPDNLILKQGISKWNNGMQYNILFPLPLLCSNTLMWCSFNYTERWYTRKIEQSYDPNVAGNVKGIPLMVLVVYDYRNGDSGEYETLWYV